MAVLEGVSLGGAIAGVPGSIAGGILGAGLDLLSFFTSSSPAEDQLALDKQTTVEGAKLQLAETQMKKVAYEKFLANIPTAGEALTGTTGDLAFDQAYRALMANLGNFGVAAGARGQVGPGTSMALLQEQARTDVGSLVDVTRETAQRQLQIYGLTEEALKRTIAQIGDPEQLAWESPAYGPKKKPPGPNDLGPVLGVA